MMSVTAKRERRRSRHECASCRQRRARFRYRGEVRADKHHTLCFECFRRERDRQRSRGVSGQRSFTFGAQSAPIAERRTPLTEREIAHRTALLANLAHQRTRSGADV